MRFISLKSAVCRTFALATDEEVFNTNKVAFITPAGFVLGNPVTQELEEIPMQDNVSFAYRAILNPVTEHFKQKLEHSENIQAPHDGYILLKDVEIRPYGQGGSIYLEALVLFTSEITGVFLASKQSAQD